MDADRKKYINSNLYEILDLEPSVQIQDVKKSYYRLVRIYHPDRVSKSEKSVANEIFKMIYQAYAILSNPDTKKVYDLDKKTLNNLRNSNVVACGWSKYIKMVGNDELISKKQKYQGSAAERIDILREFSNGNGSMTHLYNTIPFMRYEDEARMIDVIKTAMEAGEIKKSAIKKISNRK